MNQIKPHEVWIGHAGDGSDFRAIFDESIRAVVQLAVEELPAQPPRELILLRFPLVDGSGNTPDLLSLAIHAVATLLRHNIRTLVCCGAGMSRAPAVVAAALALAHHASLEACLEQVARCHAADVSPALWLDVGQVVKSEPAESEHN